MSPDTARRLVLVSLISLLVMATYKGSKPGDEGTLKRLWGVGVLGIFLSVSADFAPSLAGMFALLVALGYATSGGDAAIQNVLGKVSGSSSAPSPAPTSPGTNTS